MRTVPERQYNLIRQTEPTLNKRASKREQENIEARLENKAIAKQFEKIFCQEDALPTEIEKSEMYTEVEILKNLRKIEQIPTFTIRELTQALRRANSLSALGPDGVSSKIVKIACEDSEFQQLLLKAINNQVIVIGRTRRSLNLQK